VAKMTPAARLRGELRVIGGESLLQKLSDNSRDNHISAAIAAHSTEVPLLHAWRHNLPATRVAAFGAIRVYEGCSCRIAPPRLSLRLHFCRIPLTAPRRSRDRSTS
jgi:hypothetical protein